MAEFNFGNNIENNNESPARLETQKSVENQQNISEYIPNNSDRIQRELEQARQNAHTILNPDPLQDEQVIESKKHKANSDWFLEIPEEKRVEASFYMIQSKQKKLSAVVFAFLHHRDFAGLDDLEKVLSKNYDDLVSKKVLKDI